MKRSMAILMVFCMLFTGAAVVYGDEATRIEAEFFKGGNFLADYTDQMRMYSGNWGEYDVEFYETGVYQISLYAGTYVETAHTVALTLDGVSQSGASFTPENSHANGENYQSHIAGTLSVGSIGRHTVRVALTTGNMRFDYFTVTRIGDVAVSVAASEFIEAETQKSLGPNATWGIILNKANDDYATFSINFPVAGDYTMSFEMGNTSGVIVNYYLDGSLVGASSSLATNGNVYGDLVWREAGTLSVAAAGVHSVKIETSVAVFSLNALKFERTGGTKTTMQYNARISEESLVSADNATYGVRLNAANGDHISFSFDLAQAGLYRLSANVGLQAASTFNVFLDGEQMVFGAPLTRPGDDYTDGLYLLLDTDVATLNISTAGEHILKIVPTVWQQNLKSVSLQFEDAPATYQIIPTGVNGNVGASIYNYTGIRLTDAQIIYTVYSNDSGQLKYVQIDTVDLEPGENVVPSIELVNYSKRDTVRTLLWDSLENIGPLALPRLVMMENRSE